jgi:glucose-1-phosphate cytidylyltransferase
MKYYAHFGHKDFILCLGYKSDVIKRYFLNYEECLTNDFILTNGGKQVDLLSSDIDDWRITFVDTGRTTNIGGRLLAVREHLDNEDVFLANYTDNLSNVDMNAMCADFRRSKAVAGFLCVRPNFGFHVVETDGSDVVSKVSSVRDADVWSNGGYFILRKEVFDYLRPGEELVEEPFQRLIREQLLYAYRFEGFWACMDTYKEKQMLDTLYQEGQPPWEVWNQHGRNGQRQDRVAVAVLGDAVSRRR